MPDKDQALWRDLLSTVRRSSPAVCRHWFSELKMSGIDGGVVEVVAPTKAQVDYLRRECNQVFNDAVVETSGKLLTVRFVTEPTVSSNGSASNGREGAIRSGKLKTSGAIDELTFSPDYTFDSFVVGPNNRLAHAAARAIVDSPGRAYNPLFIHGGVGLGKTHLLQAICSGIEHRMPGARLLYISCEGFITRFIECVQNGRMDDFRHQFRDVDLLVIDDVHFLAKRDRTQDEFFHTFNSLYQRQRQIVLSSDAPPDQIPDLEERLVSRFSWGMVAPITPPEYETRVQIVKNKALNRGDEVSDDVAGFIAARIDSNIRELEGALTRVQMLANVENSPVTIEIARQALGEGDTGRERAQITLEQVVDAVIEYYDISLSNLQSKKRARSIAFPRQVCMYLARKHTRYSLEEIGGYFGGRDHSTVLHAVRKITNDREGDESVDSAVRKLERELRLVAS